VPDQVRALAQEGCEVLCVVLEVLALRGRTARIAPPGWDDEVPSVAELGLPVPGELRTGAAVDQDDGLS
jgi:hypothetical protein